MLKITQFEDVIGFTDFTVEKIVNHHVVCDFRAHVRCEDAQDLYGNIDGEIRATFEDDVLFCGLIESIQVEKFSSEAFVTVHAVSKTVTSDRKPMYRLFQNPDKTLKNIIDIVNTEGYSISYRAEGKESQPIKEPILQCGESDFAFMVRMAQMQGLYLFVLDEEKASIVIGTSVATASHALEMEQARYSRKIHQHYKNASGEDLQGEILEAVFGMPETVQKLGAEISADHSDWLIYRLVICKQQERIDKHYHLCKKNAVPVEAMSGMPDRVLLQAEVAEIEDPEHRGRIKCKLTDLVFQDPQPDQMMWVDCVTPFSQKTLGIIFVPDVGDAVELIYGSQTLRAGDSLRKEAVEVRFQKAEDKFIVKRHGESMKSVSLTEDSMILDTDDSTAVLKKENITLHTHDSTVLMDENVIQMTVGNDAKAVMKKDSITLSVGSDTIAQLDKSSLKLAVKNAAVEMKNGKLVITVGSTKIQIDNDLQTKTGKLSMEGSNVSVKGSMGVRIEGATISLK